MGMLLLNATPSVNWMPGDHGLVAGDIIQCIVVGGGAGGTYNTTSRGGAGYQSSVGVYVTAAGAPLNPTSAEALSGTGMGFGGIGATNYGGGGGAGGYIPGSPIFGGNGQDGVATAIGTTTLYVTRTMPNGNGGGGAHRAATSYAFYNPGNNSCGGMPGIDGSFGSQGVSAGGGGSAVAYGGGGGAGYGAGGACMPAVPARGGGAGAIKFGSIKLSASDITNGIAITVGGGGGGGYNTTAGNAGTASAGGAAVSGGGAGGYAGVSGGNANQGGGAGGCVILFW